MSLNIGIVGAGPTGLYALLALARSVDPLIITLFERGGLAGVGMPYSPANATVDMLANIGSIEIPPLSETYLDWLRRQPEIFLSPFGVEAATLSERGFYPRILLGMYLRDQLEQILTLGRRNGHMIALREHHEITDVAQLDEAVQVCVNDIDDGSETLYFDRLIVATGHDWHARDMPDGVVLPNPWSGLIEAPSVGPAIGIIGTSLSGIDAVVATAARFGRFTRTDGRLTFNVDAPQKVRPSITLMSRMGLLPETDFYCHLPYEPLAIFTRDAVERVCAQGQDGLLDRLFGLFLQEIHSADPSFAERKALSDATPDTFAPALFEERLAADPIEWARADLAQSLADARAHRTVAWRYAILRMHESFSDLYALLSSTDKARFDAGLRRVFVDNYAAVPPLSAERLIALADAGILSIRALGSAGYHITATASGFDVRTPDDRLRFDTLIDARGQRSLCLDDLKFPTLKAQVAEAGRKDPGTDPLDAVLSENFGVMLDLDQSPRIYLAAISFLMATRPFVQGLPGSHDIAETVCANILSAQEAREARSA